MGTLLARYPEKGARDRKFLCGGRESREVLRKVWTGEEPMEEDDSGVWWPCTYYVLSSARGLYVRTHPIKAQPSVGLSLHLHKKP